MLKCFYEHEDLPKIFIAIYSDGSGCDLYYQRNDGFCRAEDGLLLTTDKHWFTDAGYLWFIALPDDFGLWSEKITEGATK